MQRGTWRPTLSLSPGLYWQNPNSSSLRSMGAGGGAHLRPSFPPACCEPGIPSSEISSGLAFYQSLLGGMAGGAMSAYTVAGASGRQCGSISGGETEGRVGGVGRKEKALY